LVRQLLFEALLLPPPGGALAFAFSTLAHRALVQALPAAGLESAPRHRSLP